MTDWQARPRLVALAGHTGVGKTALLHRLGDAGEQTIDLEALAHHRGSAFGAVGRPPQPSHREFTASVAAAWCTADPARLLWIEDTAAFLGSVGVPVEVQRAIAVAPVVEVTATVEERRARLIAEYGRAPVADLLGAVERAATRLGAERTELARAAIVRGDLGGAAVTLIEYYDAGYDTRISRTPRARIAVTNGDDVGGLIEAVSNAIGG